MSTTSEQLNTEPKNVPIGISATGTRHETDSMGGIDVPADRYWGAQTQRSLIHFSIGDDHMPKAVYHAYGYVKKAAALVNAAAGRFEPWRANAIVRVADEVIAGKLDDNFPLYVWQTGSGTQSNMNVNEVISNRAIQLPADVAAPKRCREFPKRHRPQLFAASRPRSYLLSLPEDAFRPWCGNLRCRLQ
jgi:fumarate hydratase, class II